jgi:hypothetical protein
MFGYGRIMPAIEPLDKAIAKVQMRAETARMQADRMPRGNPQRGRYDGIAQGLQEALELIRIAAR